MRTTGPATRSSSVAALTVLNQEVMLAEEEEAHLEEALSSRSKPARLTPTLKVRRPVVLERYRAEIDDLYRGVLAV